MILPIISWWLISTILAIAAFPIVWRILGRLPDRGYGFVRTFGLLLCGYGYWLGASLQILPNSFGSITLILLLIVGLGLYASRKHGSEIVTWLREQKKTLLVMELIFALAFVLWAWVRANNPQITGTEKPMELAFINAILRSDGFPPRDPWLAGYSISYYYFGYVLLSMMTRLSGVSAGVAFNIGNSLWFALVAVGSYSLLYNVLNRDRAGQPKFIAAFLGPLLTLISGNLAGFLEVLHSRNLFWITGSDGSLRSPFWTWLGLEDLERAPIGPPSWVPQRFLWWWRSSRVIRDLDLTGIPIGTQSIDEFPFFSFLLADNHPHLLALPVVLLALGFSMQIFFKPRSQAPHVAIKPKVLEDLRKYLIPIIAVFALLNLIQGFVGGGPELTLLKFVRGLVSRIVLESIFFLGVFVVYQFWRDRLPAPLSKVELIFGAWLFGALAFLNTWDFPIYLSLFALILFWQFRDQGFWRSLRSVTPTLFALIFLGVFFYLPWYPTFASQAGGILPHMLQPTRFPHFVIMFGPTLMPISIWLVHEVVKAWERVEWRWLLGLTIGIPLCLLFLSWGLAAVILLGDGGAMSMDTIFGTLGVPSMAEMVRATLRIRSAGSWTALYLGAMIAGAVVVLRRRWGDIRSVGPQEWIAFVIIVGALLILGPEFLYLRDQFGLRMNTIFKFYFAAWILWSSAAGFVLVNLWRHRGLRWLSVQMIAVIPLLLGLVYPVLSLWTKTEQFDPSYGRSLDGSLHPSYMSSDDRDAVDWINTYVSQGIFAEAVGGSYTYYTRVSTHTGFSTVLGWPGHEGQWRGGYDEQGSRQDDIRQLYQSPDWLTTLDILNRYSIDYVYLGDLERHTYPPVFEAKFDAFMDLIYSNETVKIYARDMRGSS